MDGRKRVPARRPYGAYRRHIQGTGSPLLQSRTLRPVASPVRRGACSWQSAIRRRHDEGLRRIGTVCGAALLWLGFVDVIGGRVSAVATWLPYRWLHWARKWLWSIIGALFLGLAGSYLYDALKGT